MRAEHFALDTSCMQAAIMELQGLIRQHYPNTTFEVVHGDDPIGMYVLATVDVEDTEAVVDVYIDRLLELQIDAVANGEAVVITRSETKPVQCRVESEN